MDTVASFSLDDFNSADTATMHVVVNGGVTNWTWTFAGPGHAKAIEQSNRLSRQRLHDEKQIEAARVNGKKWKPVDETPEDIRERNIAFVIERLLGWSPVTIDGSDFPFTPENARKLLADPKRFSLLTQSLEFLTDDSSFIRRSA